MINLGNSVQYNGKISKIIGLTPDKNIALIESIEAFGFFFDQQLIVTWRDLHYNFVDNICDYIGKHCAWVFSTNLEVLNKVVYPDGEVCLEDVSPNIGYSFYSESHGKKIYEVTEISEDKEIIYVEEKL